MLSLFPFRYEYSRSGNPTRNSLEKCLASLDGAKHCMAFSSGLGATTALTHLLSAGDHMISHDDVYGGTNRYFRKVASRFGIEISFVDCTQPEKVKAAIKSNTKMVRKDFCTIFLYVRVVNILFVS